MVLGSTCLPNCSLSAVCANNDESFDEDLDYILHEYDACDSDDWDCIGRCKDRGRAGSAVPGRRMERRAKEVATSSTTRSRPRQKYTAGAARRARRCELTEVLANRPTTLLPPRGSKHQGLTTDGHPRRSASVVPGACSAPPDEERMAAGIGLDLATYRMLRQLEQRDIRPEDYELLGRLDETVKCATLSPEELLHFPTQTHCISADVVCDMITDKKCMDMSISEAAFGMDFWKLSLPQFEDEHPNCSSDCSTTGSVMQESCTVCLCELEEGDLLRVLPCSHRFHRDCIDHWLLHSSTACPACKLDLSQD